MTVTDDNEEARPPRQVDDIGSDRGRSNKSSTCTNRRSRSLMNHERSSSSNTRKYHSRKGTATATSSDIRKKQPDVRKKQQRSRSHSISSRSYSSRTSRSGTVDTASISTAGYSGSRYSRENNHSNNRNNVSFTSTDNANANANANARNNTRDITHDKTSVFDEPSRLLGFDSIIISEKTPKKRNGSANPKRTRSRTVDATSGSRSKNSGSGSGSATGSSNTRSTTRSSTRRSSSQAPSSSSRRGRSRSTNHRSRSVSRSHAQYPVATTVSAVPHTNNSSSENYVIHRRSRSSSKQRQYHNDDIHRRSRSSSKHRHYQSSTSSSRSKSRSHSQRRRVSSSSCGSGGAGGVTILGLNGSNGSGNGSGSCNISVGACNTSFGGDQSVTSKATLLPNEIEPNVHHDAIMTLEVEGPVIAEMKENEMFARKAGINFTKEGGDYLTLVSSQSDEETRSAQGEEHLHDMQLSPRMQRNNRNQHSLLYDDVLIKGDAAGDEFPPNATFLRTEDELTGNQLLGPDQDLAYLRDVAESLFVKWKGKTSPALARRLRDFQFAQEKRRKKFGNESPWGILGLYDHLTAVRGDIHWAEDAACRRANGEPYKAWFEFVDEQGTGKNRPFFTYIILALCTIFFIVSIAVNEWRVEPFSVNPMIGPSQETLLVMGAKYSLFIVEGKEVWRLITPMVLHAGVIHYFLNMLALWFIGSAIEQCHGFFASFLLFFIPAVGGTLLSAIFLPHTITIGASSGIFGLIGACVADIYMNWALLFNGFVNEKNMHRHMIVLLVLLLDIIVNSLIGLTPLVDNFAHLGGMVFGFLCGTSTMHRVTTDMFGDQKKKTFWTTVKHNALRFFGIILTVVALCTSFALLMSGDGKTTPCPSCDALSCVSFPPWKAYDKKWWYCDNYCSNVIAHATLNSTTSEYDHLSIECPSGDMVTLNFDEHSLEQDKAWLEGKLPKLCRTHCPYVEI